MVPPDPNNMTKRNTSLDILEGVMLNITEMNIAGSIPICKLNNLSQNNSMRTFNWTTSRDENPSDEPEFSNDLEISVPLPTNSSHG